MKITSVHNNLVKYWVSLKNKKVRDKERKFIIEGDHLINEAKKNNLIEYIISCVDIDADYFVTKEIMERFLDYENIYLLSMDLNAYGRFRTRMWKIDITKHLVLRERYIEWMNKLGYPKFNTTSDQPSVNFQLFPPHSGTEESFARHGNGRSNGFSKLEIQLENCEGAELVFRADENEQGIIVISKF